MLGDRGLKPVWAMLLHRAEEASAEALFLNCLAHTEWSLVLATPRKEIGQDVE